MPHTRTQSSELTCFHGQAALLKPIEWVRTQLAARKELKEVFGHTDPKAAAARASQDYHRGLLSRASSDSAESIGPLSAASAASELSVADTAESATSPRSEFSFGVAQIRAAYYADTFGNHNVAAAPEPPLRVAQSAHLRPLSEHIFSLARR